MHSDISLLVSWNELTEPQGKNITDNNRTSVVWLIEAENGQP